MTAIVDRAVPPAIRTSRRRRFRTLAVAVGLAVVVLAAAVAWFNRTNAEVVLIGDSITVPFGGVPDLVLDGTPTEVRAAPGQRVADMMAAARGVAEERPHDVVVNLGTNDLLEDRPPADVSSDLATLADLVDDASCVHLVTINEQMIVPDDPDLQAQAVDLNVRLRDLAAERGYAVVDWAGLVASHSSPDDPAFPMTVDSIHPSMSGLALMRDAVEASLEAGCPG